MGIDGHIHKKKKKKTCNQVDKGVYTCLQHVSALKCLYIYQHIAIYTHIYSQKAPKRCEQSIYTAHSHPRSWCGLYPPDTATVYHHPTTTLRAAAPAQLPCHTVLQLNRHHHMQQNKPNLLVCINSIVRVHTLATASIYLLCHCMAPGAIQRTNRRQHHTQKSQMCKTMGTKKK